MASRILSAVDAVTAPRPGTHAPPGAVFAVQEGSDPMIAASGYADLDSAEPVTERHYFDLASVSKTLTTLAIRRLLVSHALHADTTLEYLLGRRAGNGAKATIEQLLRHRAGLAEWWPLYLEPDGLYDPLGTALALPLRYAPGAEMHYSDIGMQALGGVLEAVVGTNLAEAISQLVLRPLRIDEISPSVPPAGARAAAGPDGDEIEQHMVSSGEPYPVDADARAFEWRDHTLHGEIADGNAFHAYRGVAGHAGWFGTVRGLLGIAAVLAAPEADGFGPLQSLAAQLDPGQGQGVAVYTAFWNGRERTFLGHSGFTGTMVAAAPATVLQPAVYTVLLTNRLHGRPAPGRHELQNTQTLWRTAVDQADQLLHPESQGD